jgi:WD40 repeat protein
MAMDRIWRFCILASILAAMILPGPANSEVYNSLKYGFSVEYPDGLDLVAQISASETGMDSPLAVKFFFPGSTVCIGAYENPDISLEDFAYNIKSKYEDIEDSNYTVVKIGDMNIGGASAVSMEGILEYAQSEEKTKIRDVLISSEDTLYQISCRSGISDFNRENRTHFTDLINSFQMQAINDTEEDGLPGFPKKMIRADGIWSSPALADLDGDGKKEIIFGANDGQLHALNSNGREIAGFPVQAGNYIRSSPAVADIDGDGDLEIAVGCDDSNMYVFESNGTVAAGFPGETDGGIYSSPAIADLDGDKEMEIIAGSYDRGIYAWHSDGSKVCGYPVITYGDIWSSPAISDLNADGKQDVVIGARKQCNNLIECLFATLYTEGKIFGLDYAGSSLEGFPIEFPEEIGYSSPVTCDLDGDGEIEIIFASTHSLHVMKASTGEDIKGFPAKVGDASRNVGAVMQDSFIAVSDLDRDGRYEIVSGATDGRLYVWRSDGSNMPGFPVQTGGNLRHVTIGDINGDGKQEILGGSSDNRVHAYSLDAKELPGFPKVTLDEIQTAPTLGDLEGDGSLELIAGSDDGSLYVWPLSTSYGELDWPMVRRNLQHTAMV